MIKQLPEKYETVDMCYFRRNFSCPTTESFDELRGAVMAIIDHINNRQPKKPRSTNIELRQKIAMLELNNNVLQQKCEDYLGKIIEAKQALELFCSEDVSYHPSSKIDATHARKALDQINRWKD